MIVSSVQASAAPSSMVLSANPNPSVHGQSVTISATVQASFTPTGSASFFDGVVLMGVVPLSDGVATLTTSGLSTDTHFITVIYSGDINWDPCAGGSTIVVNRAYTTTELMAAPDPSVYGQSATLTATVAAVSPGVGTPNGTVSFFDGETLLGSASLSGGVATLATSGLSGGSHSLIAVYAGDTNFLGSTSPVDTKTVNPADTTVDLSSSANPSTFGQPVTFIATVASIAPGSGTPAGTVSFFDGATLIGSGTLDSSGQATLVTTVLSGGSDSITATYDGDTNYAGSTSAPLTQTVDVATSTTTLTSSANPSTYGQSVTFTATVPAGATGTVTFKDGSATLGTATVSSGTATFTTSSLSAGSRSITATYGGDANYASSTSAVLVQTVREVTSASVTSSLNPSLHWSPVTLTAAVTGLSTPAGTVEFLDGTTSLAVVALDGSGRASLATSGLAVGSHSLTAVYSGDADHAGCTSAALAQVVRLNPPVASFTSNVTSGDFRVTVQFTDTSSNTPTAWQWDFGDGSAITADANPVHTYSVPGSYRVTLTVWNSDGSDSVEKPGYIIVFRPGAPATISMDELYSRSTPAPEPSPSASPSPSSAPSPGVAVTPASTPVVSPMVTAEPTVTTVASEEVQSDGSILWIILIVVFILGVVVAVYLLVLRK